MECNELPIIIEPYEDEYIISWLIRMANKYCFTNLIEFLEWSFYPVLYRSKNLYSISYIDNLVVKINLPQSNILSSARDIINKLTILPAVFPFVRTLIKGKLIAASCSGDQGVLWTVKNRLEYNGESGCIYVCPECMK